MRKEEPMWAGAKQVRMEVGDVTLGRVYGQRSSTSCCQTRRSWVTAHGRPLEALHGREAAEARPPASPQDCRTAHWHDNPKRVYTGRPARGVATAGGPGGTTSGSRLSANRRMTIARPSASPFSSRATSVQTGLMNDAAAPGKAGNTCVPAKYGRTYDSGFSASICAPPHGPRIVRTGRQTPNMQCHKCSLAL